MATSTSNIERIVSGCRNGDRGCMAQLYELYNKRLLSQCRSLVNDDDVARDLLHDSFIIIYTSIHQLRDHSKVEAWMTRIVERIAFQYLRTVKEQREATESLVDDALLQNDDSERRELSFDELNDIVNKLPDGYRKVFRLSVFDGMTHSQIGEILGIKPHSSSSQLFHAKALLRKMLNGKGIVLGFVLMFVGWGIYKVLTPEQEISTGGDSLTIAKTAKTDNRKDDIHTEELPSIDKVTDDEVAEHEPNAGARTLLMHKPQEEADIVHDNVVAQENEIADSVKEIVVDYVAQNIPSDTAVTGLTLTDTLPVVVPNIPILKMPKFGGINSPHDSDWNISIACNGMTAKSTRIARSHIIDPPGGSMMIEAGELTTIYNNIGSNYGYNYFNPNFSDLMPESLTGIELSDDIRRVNYIEHHELPVEISVSIMKRLNRRLSLGSGITYTGLSSTFEISNNRYGEISRQHISYLGVPLQLKFDWGNWKKFTIYNVVGLKLDLPIYKSIENWEYSPYRSKTSPYDLHVSPQWSVQFGIGAQYSINNRFGLFVEPECSYYFDNGTITYRSEHPFSFSIPIGLRLSW